MLKNFSILSLFNVKIPTSISHTRHFCESGRSVKYGIPPQQETTLEEKLKQLTPRIISILIPLLLSGCVGSFLLEGDGGYLDSCFPDIRSVPSQAEARAPRTCSNKNNQAILGNLEHARQEIQKHDQSLRKEFFPNQKK